MRNPIQSNKSVWILSMGLFLGASFTIFLQHLYTLHYQHHLRRSSRLSEKDEPGSEIRESQKQVINISDLIPHVARTPQELHHGEDELASQLFKHIRITCMLLTQPKNHENRLQVVRATWGKRCNRLYAVSTAEIEAFPTAVYAGNESRNVLWGKTKLGFRYAYDRYFETTDWFLKADDDTYMVLENLRFLLLDKDPSKPLFYGCKFKPFVRQGYMSGGAGYVLSKEALRRLVEDGLPNAKLCRQDDGGAEDAEIGNCLQNVGVTAADSRDPEGSVRFFPLAPQNHVVPGEKDKKFWYWQYIWYSHEQGIHCCSDSAIAFHYIDIRMMWTMEYLIYHLHPFGIHPQLAGTAIKDDVIRYLQTKEMQRPIVMKSTKRTTDAEHLKYTQPGPS